LRTPFANGTMVWSKNFSNGSEHNIKFPFVQSVSTENTLRQWLFFCHRVYPYSPFDNSDGKAGIPKSACRKIPGDAVGSQTLPARDFGGGLRWHGRYSPTWGCSSLAALSTAKIPCRSPPRNF
jgi:hypothetical protein